MTISRGAELESFHLPQVFDMVAVPKSLGGRVISEQPQCLPHSVPRKRYYDFHGSRLEGLNGPTN